MVCTRYRSGWTDADETLIADIIATSRRDTMNNEWPASAHPFSRFVLHDYDLSSGTVVDILCPK